MLDALRRLERFVGLMISITLFTSIFSLSVEVADFNFGETSSVDLEYKSFYHRLIDSIREVWPQRDHATDANGTDDSSLRYGPMS